MKKRLSPFFETLAYCLYIGALGFGGPFAIIAQIQRDLVEKRQWYSMEEFRRVLVVIKAMPGPIALQMVMYLARKRAGWFAGLFGGLLFILPAFLMMVALAAFYDQFQNVPMVAGFLTGIQMAAVAVIFVSLNSLTQSYWGQNRFWILSILGLLIAYIVNLPEPLIILLLGGWSVLFNENGKPPAKVSEAGTLFWVCFKAGAFLFGTGYAIVPVLQTDFVDVHAWATLEQFKDALAFGMLTPGPILTTVTFLGYKMGGLELASLATLGVFLPSFFHHLTWFPHFIDRMAKAQWLQIFLVGAIAGVTAGIIKSGLTMLNNITTFEAAVFLVSLGFLVSQRYPTIMIILTAGLAGAVPYLF